MNIVTKVAKLRLNFHATMLDVYNIANQLGILKDEKAYNEMFWCYGAYGIRPILEIERLR